MENPYVEKYRIGVLRDFLPESPADTLAQARRESPIAAALYRLTLLPPYISREAAIQIIKEELEE